MIILNFSFSFFSVLSRSARERKKKNQTKTVTTQLKLSTFTEDILNKCYLCSEMKILILSKGNWECNLHLLHKYFSVYLYVTSLFYVASYTVMQTCSD